MRQYETYLAAINALQTQWGGTFAMPIGACVASTPSAWWGGTSNASAIRAD